MCRFNGDDGGTLLVQDTGSGEAVRCGNRGAGDFPSPLCYALDTALKIIIIIKPSKNVSNLSQEFDASQGSVYREQISK